MCSSMCNQHYEPCVYLSRFMQWMTYHWQTSPTGDYFGHLTKLLLRTPPHKDISWTVITRDKMDEKLWCCYEVEWKGLAPYSSYSTLWIEGQVNMAPKYDYKREQFNDHSKKFIEEDKSRSCGIWFILWTGSPQTAVLSLSVVLLLAQILWFCLTSSIIIEGSSFQLTGRMSLSRSLMNLALKCLCI